VPAVKECVCVCSVHIYVQVYACVSSGNSFYYSFHTIKYYKTRMARSPPVEQVRRDTFIHTHTMHFSQYIDQAPLVSCAGVTVRMGLLFHATETVIQFCYFSYVVTFNNFYRVIVGLQGTCSAC